jgi:hypothetical protein
MNLLFLHHISILDGGADTCVLGKGREILSFHDSRKAKLNGFDYDTAVKRNLPGVSAITALHLPDRTSCSMLRGQSNHSLLSEF